MFIAWFDTNCTSPNFKFLQNWLSCYWGHTYSDNEPILLWTTMKKVEAPFGWSNTKLRCFLWKISYTMKRPLLLLIWFVYQNTRPNFVEKKLNAWRINHHTSTFVNSSSTFLADSPGSLCIVQSTTVKSVEGHSVVLSDTLYGIFPSSESFWR